MDWLMEPWPWWLAGILLGLIVPLMRLFVGRDFGISTSLQQIGAMCAPACKLDYLRQYDRRDGLWTLLFAIGLAAGGFVGTHLLAAAPIAFLPADAFSATGALKLFAGGIAIGFGARYAGGCTSGHAVTGIANLNGPSVIATLCFFIGGIAATWTLGGLLFGGATP